MSFEPFIDKSLIKERTEYAVVFDPNINIKELFDKEVEDPAKEFPFSLDTFQMEAIMCLENHKNVFVAAHTSAGKTVVADYAIAMAFRSMSRVIYTSPIKALSNQKYRDFRKDFEDVGILTGDIQINTEAKCLVMTTEILLQMLYNKSKELNDLEWVIFDECHYLNDRDRGHVWEEVFILLPKICNLVLLSATVPNVVQFADWLGRARNQLTYVVSTSKRPVPLQHHLYLGRDGKSKDQIFLIVDSDKQFKADNYKEAEDIVNNRKGFQKKTSQEREKTERNIYLTLIRYLKEKDKLPVICFTLSRNRCDTNLRNLMEIGEENLKLTTKDEESRIHRFVWRHLSRLKECDRKLPQIQTSVAMLKRGFGVHHSGILPILKEITEILFSDGLVKVLVATETFAMGVNMPARTVVFDSIEKHDGNNWRDLRPSEYIQMAGRAGRRGKDKTGTVIILCKFDIPDSPRLLSMMQGQPTKLESQFRLTYHMICNLHKTCETDQSVIESFLEQSFGEHNRSKRTPEIIKELSVLKSQIDSFPDLKCDFCSDIETFYNVYQKYKSISEKIVPKICHKALEKGKLNQGRIICFSGEENPFEYGVILKVNKVNNEIISLTVLSVKNKNQFEYKNIEINSIHKFLNKQFSKKFDYKTIIEENENKRFKKKEETNDFFEKLKDFGLENNYSVLSVDSIDPKKNLQIKEIDSIDILDNFMSFGQKLLDFKCIKCKDFVEHFQEVNKLMTLLEKSENLEYKLSTQSLQFLPDYNSRIEVLKCLDYMEESLVLKLKGKIASLISEFELILTEMLMNNVIGTLKPEEIAALLSAFVFQQSKANQILEVTQCEALIRKRNEVEKLENYIAITETKFNVPKSMADPVLNFDLMEVVYQWALGRPFIEVLELTEVQEGIIVRCIQRLDELLKFVKLSAKQMGNKELEDTIELASQVIRRDIVFCQSLYTISDDPSNEKENQDNNDENLSSNFV